MLRAAAWDEVAAPGGETVPLRSEDPARRRLGIAVGRGLLEIIGPGFADRVHGQCELELAVTATTDRDAIDLVRVGRQDAALVLGELSPRDIQAGLRQVWLGSEVFAVATSAASPVTNLGRADLRALLTGQVTSWSKLGGNATIVQLVLPRAPERLQRAAQVLITGDDFAQRGLRVGSDAEVFEQIRRAPGALGIVSLTTTPCDPEFRLLSVDRVPPMVETFAVGTWPFGQKLVLVTSGAPGDLAAMLLEFLRSPAGKELFASSLVVF